jgi:hypothetical protein
MNTNCIKYITRPNLYKLNEDQLLDIIYKYEPEWNIKKEYSRGRDDMVVKVFDLWSNYELEGIDSKPIECLICWDALTNGNNITFECGHKFHSKCIVKSLLIFSTDTYINYLDDKEKNSVDIEYCCPQCKKSIELIKFSKNN